MPSPCAKRGNAAREAGKAPNACDSVHLESFPIADPSQVDEALEQAMVQVREVVTMGRNLREQQKIRIRQPLPGVQIAMLNPIREDLRGVMADIVSEELNQWLELNGQFMQ